MMTECLRGMAGTARSFFQRFEAIPERSPFVMPGLDPGIHRDARRREGMDSRVKPANDDLALCGAGSEQANPPINPSRE
jgi:hypothetical protein